jgi:hypothetical protein
MNWHLRVVVAVSATAVLVSAAEAGQTTPPRPTAAPVATKAAPGVDAPEVDGTTALHRAV